MIIRIPLTDKNCKITPVFTDSPAPPESGSETFTLPEISFSLSPAPLPDIPAYNFSRYSHPCTEINVGVPEADMPLVKAWLGISPGQAGATPGDTLVKRMTTAVTSAIENYFSATARKSIFTRPFRIAYAMKLPTALCSPFPRRNCCFRCRWLPSWLSANIHSRASNFLP